MKKMEIPKKKFWVVISISKHIPQHISSIFGLVCSVECPSSLSHNSHEIYSFIIAQFVFRDAQFLLVNWKLATLVLKWGYFLDWTLAKRNARIGFQTVASVSIRRRLSLKFDLACRFYGPKTPYRVDIGLWRTKYF